MGRQSALPLDNTFLSFFESSEEVAQFAARLPSLILPPLQLKGDDPDPLNRRLDALSLCKLILLRDFHHGKFLISFLGSQSKGGTQNFLLRLLFPHSLIILSFRTALLVTAHDRSPQGLLGSLHRLIEKSPRADTVNRRSRHIGIDNSMPYAALVCCTIAALYRKMIALGS